MTIQDLATGSRGHCDPVGQQVVLKIGAFAFQKFGLDRIKVATNATDVAYPSLIEAWL